MASTDHVFKQLVTIFILGIAAWVLKVKVRFVITRDVVLQPPTDAIVSDLIFEVVTDDNRRVILSFEFQGKSSRKPMPLRILEYLTRMGTGEYRDMPIHSGA